MKVLQLPAILTLSSFLLLSASAQTVLINFGGAAYSGTDSPGHDVGAVSGTNWNTMATDTASGIVDQNGDATSVGVNFSIGSSGGGSTTATYSGVTKAADYTLGVTAPLFDSALGTSNAVRNTGLGVGIGYAITGLAAGTYDFYVTSFRGDTATNKDNAYTYYGAVSSDVITDFSSLELGTVSNSNVTTWEDSNNYLIARFTVTETDDTVSLFVTGEYTDGAAAGDPYIGILNSVEIVAVPEPGSIAMILAGLALGFAVWRRR